MDWIKINPNHRPAKGHLLYSSFNPEEFGGTSYYVREVSENGFTVQSDSNNDGKIPEDQTVTLFVPYDLISITNFWVWDRHRENNYEIDEVYSN